MSDDDDDDDDIDDIDDNNESWLMGLRSHSYDIVNLQLL